MTQSGEKLSGLEQVPSIASDDIILTEIFVNDMGFETDLFETATEGWAVIRVDDVIDSRLRSLGEVKEQAKTLWQDEKINEALDEKMLELAEQAQTGETLETLLAGIEQGATLDTAILVRSTPNETIGRPVSIALAQAAVGDIERGEGPQPMTRQIAKLTKIVSNQDSLAGQYADHFQDQLTAAIKNDLSEAYQLSVLKDHPRTEYPEKVKQALGLDNEG